MSEYNIQMNKYNALNAEYDQLYPATKIENVDGLDTALQKKADLGDDGKVLAEQLPDIPTAVLNVTTNAGVVVTATKGSKVMSATADSSGLVVLYPDEFGTWTIKATLSGKSLEVSFEIDAIAVFNTLLLVDLESTSWELISKASEAGNAASFWSVGDTKNITIDGVSYPVQIIGFNHDTKTAGGKAGITFQMVDCMNDNAQMNSTRTNGEGWGGCAMRTSVLSSTLSNLPADLQNVIKAVNKSTSAGSSSSTINTTSDKLFLLSEVEIFGSITYSKSGEGSQYDFYKAGNSKVKKVNGSAAAWFDRSPNGSTNNTFCTVDYGGNANHSYANNACGVSFGFCV